MRGTTRASWEIVFISNDYLWGLLMRSRMLAAAVLAMLAPAALFAGSLNAAPAPSASKVLVTVKTAYSTAGQKVDQDYGRHDREQGDYDDRGDKGCGRGNAWGCRRKNDERYDSGRRDDHWEHERYERARYEREQYERERYEHERYARERYERQRARERYEREQYERERYERDRYDQRDGYYQSRPVACVRAGNRIVGGVVVTVCLP